MTRQTFINYLEQGIKLRHPDFDKGTYIQLDVNHGRNIMDEEENVITSAVGLSDMSDEWFKPWVLYDPTIHGK
jgi:hypothetical protein